MTRARRPRVSGHSPHQPRTRTVGLAIFAALCVYVIYQMTSNSSEWYLGGSGSGSGCPTEEFVRQLSRRSTPDKFIVLALVDTAFTDMAINLYHSSLLPHGIDNFLFVGAGRRACEILHNASLPCHHYTEDKDTDVASIYKSPDFIRKMNIRTDMILDALSVGYTILHTDLDVVFLRNPLADLKVLMLNADIATMWDSTAHNAGFVVIRPTWYSRNVYERMKRITSYSRKTDDQTALNTAIYAMNRTYKRRGFKAVTLDTSRYLCGVDYFEKGRRVFPTDDNCTACYVVHNNWIVSREAKIYRFKEHHMWMYDKDTYYSSPTQLYLVYHNPITWSTSEISDREELNALKAALAIGQLLDRVVILPRFHCSLAGGGLGGSPAAVSRAATSASSSSSANGARWARRRPRQQPQRRQPSTASPVPNRECPLNGLLNVTAFDAEFDGFYRENSFLTHPLVPADVRLDATDEIPLHRLLSASDVTSTDALPTVNASTAAASSGNSTVFQNAELPSTPLEVDADEIVRLLGTSPRRVLVLRSLYRISVKFGPTANQREVFERRTNKAFKRGTYRQL